MDIAGGSDVHDSIGFNSKFTEMQEFVIGLEQMKKLVFRIERKKEIWKKYRDNLSDIRFNKFTLITI